MFFISGSNRLSMGLFASRNSGGIWMVWRNAGGICERKTLFRMKKKRIKPGLKARERTPYLDRDENIGSKGDYAIIENSKMVDQVSTEKRKHYEEAECLVVQTGTPQQ